MLAGMEVLHKLGNIGKLARAVLAREYVGFAAEHVLGLHVSLQVARVPQDFQTVEALFARA